MQRFIVGFALAAAIAVLPQFAAAKDGKPQSPPQRPKALAERPAPKGFDAKAAFVRLDADKDGKLSLEEFAVGFRHMRQMMLSRMHAWKGPVQGGMQFAYGKMGAFKAQFAPKAGPKCFRCPCPMYHKGFCPMNRPMGKDFVKGPKGPYGKDIAKWHKAPHGKKDFTKGPKTPHGKKDFTKGPKTPHGKKDFAKGLKYPHGKKDFAKGPKTPHGKEVAKKGKKFPQGKSMMPKGPKPPKAPRPDFKKPEPPKPEVKQATAGGRSIEARLTALERQQTEILALLRGVRSADKTKAKELARGPHRDQPKRGPADRE